jgi:cellulose synthase/poly-beta-1,6-N-acetylglucosamine synthase-like glycosyltransferase
MGAFGACFAIRGRLFDAVPEHFIVDDFYHTLRCFELGYDAIVEPEAVCYEAVSEEVNEEFRRKKRIATGNLQNLHRFWRFLLPWNGGAGTSFAFWSHKGLRWLGPFFIGALFLSSLVLAFFHWIYVAALAGLCLLFAGATLDYWLGDMGIRSGPLRLIRYFLLMNLALFLGAIQFLRGARSNVWEPTRRVAGCHSPPSSPRKRKSDSAVS